MAARRRIALAQKKRWAKWKKGRQRDEAKPVLVRSLTPRRISWDDRMKKRLARLRRDGLGAKAIAQEMGLRPNQIHTALNRLGIDKVKTRRVSTQRPKRKLSKAQLTAMRNNAILARQKKAAKRAHVPPPAMEEVSIA